MSHLDIKYLGGIDDKEVGSNFTGSATLIKSSKDVLGGNKIIIDFGMFQGFKKAGLLNKKIPEELLDADFLVVTHAHLDHIGLVPLLVKKGFKGKIIMTSMTKNLAFLQWKSNIELLQTQREELINGNRKKGEKLREYLKFVNSYERLNTQNNLNKKQKNKIENNLKSIAGNINLEEFYNLAKKELENLNINNSSDIEKNLNQNIPELLYDIDDVYKTLEQIETLEYGEEISLDSRIVITKKDSEVIEKLPEIIENGYNKKIYVLPGLKQVIIDELNQKYNKVVKHNKENKKLREELKKSYRIIKKYNKNPDLISSEELGEFNSIEDFIIYHRNFLKKYDILFPYDIEKLKELVKPLPYTKKQINKVISRLELILERENEKIVESIKLRFYKAGHIEGSAMASITYVTKEIKNKINGILERQKPFTGFKEIKKSHKNLLFSGDLGKLTDSNLSGSPDIPKLKYNYAQIETTYSNKNHPDKQKEFERLKEILKRPGPKLGAAFAIDRTQEISVDLLKSDYSGTIYLDSLLATKVTEEFIKNIPEKYKILDLMIQKQKFGKERFKIFQDSDIDKLYNGNDDFLVLSNSGMLEGGRIIEHLKRVVSDPEATIILFGYVAKLTLGRKLLNGAKKIKIHGKLYEVKCKVEFIEGYSSHMGQKDLVNFSGKQLNYPKNAKLALTHGDEERYILKGLIEEVNKKFDILVPKLGDKIRINL